MNRILVFVGCQRSGDSNNGPWLTVSNTKVYFLREIREVLIVVD